MKPTAMDCGKYTGQAGICSSTSSVNIVTRLRTGRPRNRGSIPIRRIRFVLGVVAELSKATLGFVMSVRLSTGPSSSTGSYNPLAGFSLLILEVLRSHIMTRHSR